MSSVFEPVVSGSFVVKNGKSNGNGNGTALRKAHNPLGLNAEKVISKRYSLKDEIGEPLESWADIVRRVVGFVSTAEKDPMMRDYFYSSMLDVMLNRQFVPNTPCLVNAGKPFGQLAACFVLNVPDSINGIMDHASAVATIHQTGGGTGMTYEFLRPAGSMVNSTRGVASGPVSFMNIVNGTTEVVKQGGVRRGANMGIMRCLAGNTMISTIHGRKAIKDLVGLRPYLYCTDGSTVRVRQADAIFSNGVRKTVRVWFDDDTYLDCTPDHEILLSDRKTYREAGELKFGDSVAVLSKRLINNRYHLSVTGSRHGVPEHIAVGEMKYGVYPTAGARNRQPNDTVIHHIDHNPLNNSPENLELMTLSAHGIHHGKNDPQFIAHRERIAAERKGKTWEEYYGAEKASELRARKSKRMKGGKPWNKGLNGNTYKEHYENGFANQHSVPGNHKVVRVESLEIQEVFDISMPEFHNFVANGVFVHNCTHPDVLRFIHAKNDQHSLTNFNISVTVTDDFMNAVDNKEWFQTEFDDGEWNQTVFDPVTGNDYVVYRRPDGSTATFADKLAFETADLSDCTIEIRPRREWFTRPTSGIASSLRHTNTPNRASSILTK